MPQLPCNKTILKVCKNSMHLRWGMVLRINDIFPIDPITNLEIKSYIENISYNGSNIEATLTLSENVDDFVSVSDIITFHGDRGLNFHAERNITGVNIIDGMIFWTDNYSEPKKVNIERGKMGSISHVYGAGYDGSQLRERTTWSGKISDNTIPDIAYYSDFDQHTKLIIDESTVNECEKSTIFCPVLGCTDPNATNYDPNATVNDGSCALPPIPGCTNINACNYNPLANQDDGSCVLPDGCTDPLATNYDPAALCDDGSCITPAIVIYGCMDVTALNYDATATGPCDSSSMGCFSSSCGGPGTAPGDCCEYGISGCMDPSASNYDASATTDSGDCVWTGECSNCNYYPLITTPYDLIMSWTNNTSNASIGFQTTTDYCSGSNPCSSSDPHTGNLWSEPIGFDASKLEYALFGADVDNWGINQQGYSNLPYNVYHNDIGQQKRYRKIDWIGVMGFNKNGFSVGETTASGWPGYVPQPVWDVSNPLHDSFIYLRTTSNAGSMGGVSSRFPSGVQPVRNTTSNPNQFSSVAPNLTWTQAGVVKVIHSGSSTTNGNNPNLGWGCYQDFITYINAALFHCNLYTSAGTAFLQDNNARDNNGNCLQFDISQNYAEVKAQLDPLLNTTKLPYSGATFNLGTVSDMGGENANDYQTYVSTFLPMQSGYSSNWEVVGNYPTDYNGPVLPYANGPAVSFDLIDCMCGRLRLGSNTSAPIWCDPDIGDPGYCPACESECGSAGV